MLNFWPKGFTSKQVYRRCWGSSVGCIASGGGDR